MAQRLTTYEVSQHEDPALAPLTIIRTETVLSRLPIHTLAKKGRVPICIIQKNTQGEIELYWRVSPNADVGEPRQLAYKLDTLVINRRIDELGRPLPKILRLDSFKQICATLDMTPSGRTNNHVKQAFHENAGAYIIAKLRYTATNGTQQNLEAGFTRYSVIFTGERLPDGTTADAIYLLLNEPYWEILNNAPTRPLDYDYLKVLPPAAQRCYEILSYKLFATLKYQYPEAKMLYSEYCTFSAQQRYTDYSHVKKQMYKVHKPHVASGYLSRVRYETTTAADGRPDWVMYYVPGPKAHTEYLTFTTRSYQRRASTSTSFPDVNHAGTDEPLTTLPPTVVTPPTTASPLIDEMLTSKAHALVQYFHQRFHETPDVTPTTKALVQAHDLIVQYGMDQARHIIDFSVTVAHATDYHPHTLGGILHYTTRALADYAQAQQQRAAVAHTHDEQRRMRDDEQQHHQYEKYRTARLAHLRATLPVHELAAIEAAAATRVEREHTGPFGRDLLRRIALDDTLATHGQIPSFTEWQTAERHR